MDTIIYGRYTNDRIINLINLDLCFSGIKEIKGLNQSIDLSILHLSGNIITEIKGLVQFIKTLFVG